MHHNFALCMKTLYLFSSKRHLLHNLSDIRVCDFMDWYCESYSKTGVTIKNLTSWKRIHVRRVKNYDAAVEAVFG